MTSAFLGPVLLGLRAPTPTAAARPRLAVIAVFIVALVVGFGVGRANAADPQLDQALLALEKARALVGNTSADGASDKTQRRFARHTARAVEHIAEAMAEIEAAKDAYDNP